MENQQGEHQADKRQADTEDPVAEAVDRDGGKECQKSDEDMNGTVPHHGRRHFIMVAETCHRMDHQKVEHISHRDGDTRSHQSPMAIAKHHQQHKHDEIGRFQSQVNE